MLSKPDYETGHVAMIDPRQGLAVAQKYHKASDYEPALLHYTRTLTAMHDSSEQFEAIWW